MANNSGFQIVQLIGTGVVTAAVISWLVPKLSRPKTVVAPAVPVIPHPAVASIANSPTAATLGGGMPRDYNLSGLAIEDLDGYPSEAGVSLSGI